MLMGVASDVINYSSDWLGTRLRNTERRFTSALSVLIGLLYEALAFSFSFIFFFIDTFLPASFLHSVSVPSKESLHPCLMKRRCCRTESSVGRVNKVKADRLSLVSPHLMRRSKRNHINHGQPQRKNGHVSNHRIITRSSKKRWFKLD